MEIIKIDSLWWIISEISDLNWTGKILVLDYISVTVHVCILFLCATKRVQVGFSEVAGYMRSGGEKAELKVVVLYLFFFFAYKNNHSVKKI